jgi:CubicO group peptidase (beta-lactamase class C family)
MSRFVLLSLLVCRAALADSSLVEAANQATQKLRSDPNYKGLMIGVMRADVVALVPYGNTDEKHPKPITADSVFAIGSVTKTFPALLLAKMTLAKMVHVKTSASDGEPDEKVSQLMKELGLASQYPLPFQRADMTLADLADHHAGLPKKFPNLTTIDGAYKDLVTCPVVATKAEMKTSSYHLCDYTYACSSDSHCYCDCSLPGTFLYSNFGFQILAHLLAAKWKPGKTWAAINTEIISPLGMTHTHVQSDLTGWEKDRLAVVPTLDPLFSTGDEGNASGNMFSTGNDMAKWLSYNGGPCAATGCAAELAILRYPRNNECAPRETCNKQIGLAWTIEPLTVKSSSSGSVELTMYSKGGDAPNYHAFIAYALGAGPQRGVFILKNWDDSHSTPSLKSVGEAILKAIPQ